MGLFNISFMLYRLIFFSFETFEVVIRLVNRFLFVQFTQLQTSMSFLCIQSLMLRNSLIKLSCFPLITVRLCQIMCTSSFFLNNIKIIEKPNQFHQYYAKIKLFHDIIKVTEIYKSDTAMKFHFRMLSTHLTRYINGFTVFSKLNNVFWHLNEYVYSLYMYIFK